MRILGFYDDHNASAAIIEDGQILAAIEEERLSRIKLHDGNTGDGPAHRCIAECLRITKSERGNIDRIAVAVAPPKDLLKYVLRDLFNRQKNPKWILASLITRHPTWDPYFLFYPYFYNRGRLRRIKKLLRRFDLHHLHIDLVDHHTAHAASAYYTGGDVEAKIFTLDGQGDGDSGSIFIGSKGKLELVKRVPSYHSVGLFYNFITWYLGFKPNRHEGKITGLAAYGDPNKTEKFYHELFKIDNTDFSYDLAKKIFQHAYPHRTNYPRLVDVISDRVNGYSKEDIAAGIQNISERMVTGFVQAAMRDLNGKGSNHVKAAGGVFANVRINQKVAETPGVESLFIFPAMGDCGLSCGAALHSYYRDLKFGVDFREIPRLDHVYLGPDYPEEAIETELKKSGLRYEYFDGIEAKIADLLAAGEVVARFNGRMEFGPRALGNRSILYQPTDPTVNDWLNERLNRTEFMPFAPVSPIEDRDHYYKNVGLNSFPAKFMTITFDCTDEMKQKCPAVVHVDGTARPQLVEKRDNPSYYRILEEYRKRTGLRALINTSFNMHEEPIVCSPYDAIRAFKLGHLGYLALGKFLVHTPES
jgi:carbamoyltransferase